MIKFGLALRATRVVSFFVYRWMTGRFPDNPQRLFLELALGFGILFTILAGFFFRKAFWEMTVLHLLYIAGFGWILPMLLTF